MYSFSSYKAFQSQLSELNDLAGQHEIVAETMVADIVTVSNQFCNEGKQDKKKVREVSLLYGVL